MRETADVVVIGGGIIGCAIAYEFARAGRSVVVLERGRIGGEASSASGGILVPLHDAEEGERTPQYDLDRASQLLFPDLVSDLEGATGMDLQFERTGSLRVARSEDEAELLREQFEGWRSELDIGVEWVDEKGTREMEPHLGPEVQSSVYCAEEWSISSTRMVRALARAADQLGAVFYEDTPVFGARCSGGECKALLTPEGEVSAGEFVIAAGAWSRVPCGWFGVEVPISPARGQMAAVRSVERLLRHIILCSSGGISPKQNGQVWVGSTVELVGFQKRNTPEGLLQILAPMAELVPEAATAAMERTWSGLRPFCEDGLHAIGRLPGVDGVTIASGHFKMGIIGAPMTALAVRDLVEEGHVHPVIEPFSPARFAAGYDA
jgi:glycine oxidase